jgi:adenylate kinase family enzyme
MDRILVLGSSGSGKSTLARALGERLDIEVIHLDSHFWMPNWQAMPEKHWDAKLRTLLERHRWVMDGNYPESLEMRLGYADTVVFIDHHRLICLGRCIRRFINYRGNNRPELAPGCHEKIDWEFFQWIWDYPRNVKPWVLQVLEKYEDDVRLVHLRSSSQVRVFLADPETS